MEKEGGLSIGKKDALPKIREIPRQRETRKEEEKRARASGAKKKKKAPRKRLGLGKRGS